MLWNNQKSLLLVLCSCGTSIANGNVNVNVNGNGNGNAAVPGVRGGRTSSSASSSSSSSNRILQSDENVEERVRTDLVRLIPFDVQLAMTLNNLNSNNENENAANVNIYALNDIVTDWMSDSFLLKSKAEGLLSNNTSFNSVALELTDNIRRRNFRKLQEPTTTTAVTNNNIVLYTASFEGISLWERTGFSTIPMDPELVELIQRATFLEDNKLLSLLQSAEPYTGLGTQVVNVRAYITPANSNANLQNNNNDDDENSNLQIIIIIAIVVACLAFGLLMFAVIWAWKTDQTKRDVAFSLSNSNGNGRSPTKSATRSPDGTRSESDYDSQKQKQLQASSRPPTEIMGAQPHPNSLQDRSNNGNTNDTNNDNTDYADSVISEDISTSLTAYYRTGMGVGYGGPGYPRNRDLNDAASMSSMDSYGYSLDGYAPSLSGGPTQMGYPATLGSVHGNGNGAEPVNGQIKDPDDDCEAEESVLGEEEAAVKPSSATRDP